MAGGESHAYAGRFGKQASFGSYFSGSLYPALTSLRTGKQSKKNKDIPASPHVQVPEYVRWQEGGWRFFYEQAQRTLAAFIPHARNFVLCLSIFDDRSKNPMQQILDAWSKETGNDYYEDHCNQ